MTTSHKPSELKPGCLGGWLLANRGDVGEHTMGDLRDVAYWVGVLEEFVAKHNRLPKDFAELQED